MRKERAAGFSRSNTQEMKPTDAESAAVLYLAINGWGAEPTCAWCMPDHKRCGKPLAGVSADDGAPLCAEHVVDPEDEGHRLSKRVIEAIRRLRKAHMRAAKRKS